MNEGKKVKAAVGRGPSEGGRHGMDRRREERTGLQQGGFRGWFTEGETGSLGCSLDLISRKSGARSIPRFARSFVRHNGGFCASTSSRTCSPRTRLTEQRPAIGRVHGCVTPNKSSISSDKIEISATASSDFALTNHVTDASESALPYL